ncbi:MAG: hypothetical protein KDD61_01665 [Bdellovibrionales bacterium]|nr:hypothetical protein [Bdellovibrionales bacterium]
MRKKCRYSYHSQVFAKILNFFLLSTFLLSMACENGSRINDLSQDSSPIGFHFSEECSEGSLEACEVFELVNTERLRHGLTALIPYKSCRDSSQFHAQDMDQRHFFDHDSPTETWQDRLIRFQVTGRSIGENIVDTRTPASAISLWMNSPPHRENILNPNFTHSGMGYYNGFWVQCFAENPYEYL